MSRGWARALAVAALGGVLVVLGAAPATAHPLGNFSVNTYSAVVVEPSAVRADLVVDRAEIPTRQAYPTLDDRSGTLPGGEQEQAAAEGCAAAAAGARLLVDGRPVALPVVGASLTFPPGAAGLRTARLVCRLAATELDGLVGAQVQYALTPPVGAVGWHETTAVGDGVRVVGSDVPDRSVSDGLRSYPEDLLGVPLDVRSASFSVAAGSGAVAGVGGLLEQGPLSALPRGADRVTGWFTGLVERETLSTGFVLGAVGLSVLLGAAHAFAPGHGKTVMAAYLLGRRGALRDAVVIGASVTVTHTAGVLALGIGLTAVGLASPAALFPWLGLASGLLLAGIGVALLRTARRRPLRLPTPPQVARELVPAGAPVPTGGDDGHDHDHHGHHGHDNHGHDHEHEHHHEHDHEPGADVPGQPHSHGLFSHTHDLPPEGSGVRGLLLVGFAGGMVPSPSALVVLLGGTALGRAWLGLVLVVAYGVGMAVALALTGVLLARGRDRVVAALARAGTSRRATAVARAALVLPAVTAVAVVLVGAGVALRAAVQLA